jgi:hypothetical protein
MLLLTASRKIVFSIHLFWLTPYADQINGERLCEFRRNISTTDQIFNIRQIP